MSSTQVVRPPLDAELGLVLAQMPDVGNLTSETLGMMRQSLDQMSTADATFANKPVTWTDQTIPGLRGEITLSIVRPRDTPQSGSSRGQPCIFFIHGGGMVAGNRFVALNIVVDWAIATQAVVVSVEYRRAPEHPYPAPLEDCYSALKWTSTNAASLGIDPEKLLLAGQSAGGGLAAATALYARDHGGPQLCGQLLMCPMLDDRNESTSSKQYEDMASWTRGKNSFGWGSLLEGKNGTDEVSMYASPARAENLSNLPPTFIDVGSAEVFRDENVSYAMKLWACGVQAELHVWPGGFHGFDLFAPTAELSVIAIQTRLKWVERLLTNPNK